MKCLESRHLDESCQSLNSLMVQNLHGEIARYKALGGDTLNPL